MCDTPLTQITQEGGNTKCLPPPKKRYRNWCFTYNNYDKSIITQIISFFKSDIYVFQEETGSEGTKHLQGCLILQNGCTFSALKLKIPGAHIERMRSKKASIAYCCKLNTRTGKVFHNNIILPEPIFDKLSVCTLFKWQQQVVNIVRIKPDDRTIHWFWEPKGNTGKSVLCKHLVLNFDAIIVGGRATDAQYAIINRLKNNKPIPIVIFDIPRNQNNNISYTAVENIKNGLFFSAKYESDMCIFNSPHILIFANYEPQQSELSIDRWDIHEIEQI